jgi:hypothetical protein
MPFPYLPVLIERYECPSSAAWGRGASEADVEAIRAAKGQSPALRTLAACDRAEGPLMAPGFATSKPPEAKVKNSA